MEISVILPSHNIEKYIATSLDSIRLQTFKDWECVIVDDGSTDSTIDICQSFVDKDPRFRILKIEKPSGVAQARNIGIQNAKGKYIVFVDSDDWVEPDYLQTLHSLITDNDVDMVQCGFFIEKKAHTYRENPVTENTFLSKDEALWEAFNNGKVHSALWSKIFKREVVEASMPEKKTYEDMYAVTSWLNNMQRILLAPQIIYHYRQRKSSIINSNFARNKLDYLNACIFRSQFMQSLYPDTFDESKKTAYIHQHGVNTAKVIARNEGSYRKKKECILEISRILNTLPFPEEEGMRKKTLKRAKKLRNHPLLFLNSLSFLSLFNIRAFLKRKDLFE